MKKFLSLLGNVFTVVILVFAIVMTVMVITSVHSDAKLPNLFGYALMNVETDSMESENGFYVGDMIIVRLLDDEEANNLKVGDVITFRRVLGQDEYLETHRIVEISPKTNPFYEDIKYEVVDGIWKHGSVSYYMTQGDNTPDVDYNSNIGGIEYSHKGVIVGVWTGKRIPVLGGIMKFLQSQAGFMICIVIPIALFFIYQLYVFIMTLTRKQKEKALEEVSSKEEELKQKAIAEFLAQQQAAGGGNAPPAPEPAPEQAPSPEAQPEPAPAPEAKPEEPASVPASEETPEEAAQPAPAADPNEISEAEKQRIIQEYLAKQAQESKPEE